MVWVRNVEGQVVVRVGRRRVRITKEWAEVNDETATRLRKEQRDALESVKRNAITLPVDLEFSEEAPPPPEEATTEPTAGAAETKTEAPEASPKPAKETKKAKK